MSRLNELVFLRLQFYLTASYPCSYLPEQRARSQVATPAHLIDTELYGELVRAGFRRSGLFTYRPRCDACSACIPVRVPVAGFSPSRTQRRTLRRHGGLDARIVPIAFSEEHYALYRRYQSARHAGGGMDTDGREQFTHFLLSTSVDTRLVEFREDGMLRMVSVVDVLDDGMSAVYAFFDPDVPGASYGVYNVLWQIGQVRAAGKPHVYLGYWIRDSRKMAYKAGFQPLEMLVGGRWRRAGNLRTSPV